MNSLSRSQLALEVMMHTLDLRHLQPSRAELAAMIPRALTDVEAATDTAASLIADVRSRVELALLDQA
jgi:histidinol dehydrogenase